MSKPYIHALSSARKFGGCAEDYLPIHNLFDLSKGAIADHRHRAITHNSFFIGVFLERIPFPNSAPPVGGLYTTIINSDGKHVSVRDIGEQHCMEDFHGFIPTFQDYADHMEITDWMNNGKGKPNSIKQMKTNKVKSDKKDKFFPFEKKDGDNVILKEIAEQISEELAKKEVKKPQINFPDRIPYADGKNEDPDDWSNTVYDGSLNGHFNVD